MPNFQLHQLACLWENQEPSLPSSHRAKNRFETLAAAARSGALLVRRDNLRQVIVDAIDETRGIKVKADPLWIVSRKDAIAYANSINEMPPFLFPKERV